MSDCFVLYKEAPVSPILEYQEPLDRVYPKGEFTVFPTCLEVSTGATIADKSYTVVITLTGPGILGNTYSGQVTGWQIDSVVPTEKVYTITGDLGNSGVGATLINYLNEMNVLAPDDGNPQDYPPATGVTNYSIVMTNSEGACASALGKFIPTTLVSDGQSACVDIVISGINTGEYFAVYVDEQEITSPGGVQYTGSGQSDFVDALVADINGQTDILPVYVASKKGTGTFPDLTVCTEEGMSDLNGASAYLFNINRGEKRQESTVEGGVDNNKPGLFGQIWEKSSDVLLGVAGNVAGGVLANWIFPNSGITEITIPQNNPDEPPPEILLVLQGRIVQVPLSYNQDNRNYPGTYDSWVSAGRPFELLYTDCPAWCLYDYITNIRFGLGNDIILNETQLHLLQEDLFGVMFFSDEKVDAGQKDGTTEPRFSCNVAISEGTKMDILEALCSNFNGGYTFADGGLRITMDGEITDFSNAKIVNQASVGPAGFKHTHNSLKSFVNKVNVGYVDPETFYQSTIVTVEDQQGIAIYGEKVQDIFAYACTSRAQAARYGNWVLESEKRNRDIVNYKAGWDHYDVKPGDIVYLEDSMINPERLGGRVIDVTFTGGNTQIYFDAPVTIDVGVTQYSIRTVDAPQTPKQGTLQPGPDATHIVITGVDLTGVVPIHSPYILQKDNAVPLQYRVVKISEENEVQYNVIAQIYDGGKYSAIYADYFVGV